MTSSLDVEISNIGNISHESWKFIRFPMTERRALESYLSSKMPAPFSHTLWLTVEFVAKRIHAS